MNNNPVIWFELYVQDMQRAQKFYKALFGTEFQKIETQIPGLDMWAFPMEMDEVGAGGALVKMEGVTSGFAGTLVYFSCEDCGVTEARAAANGGKVERPKMSIGENGFISLVYDTEGNLIGLHSMA